MEEYEEYFEIAKALVRSTNLALIKRKNINVYVSVTCYLLLLHNAKYGYEQDTGNIFKELNNIKNSLYMYSSVPKELLEQETFLLAEVFLRKLSKSRKKTKFRGFLILGLHLHKIFEEYLYAKRLGGNINCVLERQSLLKELMQSKHKKMDDFMQQLLDLFRSLMSGDLAT